MVVLILKMFALRHRGDDITETGTLRPKDFEDCASQKTITPSLMSTPTKRSSNSSISGLEAPEVKYARPVK